MTVGTHARCASFISLTDDRLTSVIINQYFLIYYFINKMEVFNKLYSQVSSSVSSTVSQLSGVLPGNPVTREFDASTHIASAGPGTLLKNC